MAADRQRRLEMPGGARPLDRLRPSPPPRSEPALREALARSLTAARLRTDALFDWVRPDGLLMRPIAERHRLVFYVGHLDAFDWNLLCRDACGVATRNAEFERLFAFGIDPLDGNLPRDGADDWPGVSAIRAWISAIRADVDTVIARAPLTGWLAQGWAVHLAIEHRLMHAETLAYLLNRMPLDQLARSVPPIPVRARASAPAMRVQVPGGPTVLGKDRDRDPYSGWDNEYQSHRVEVPAFEVDRYPVSNAEFRRFVEAGGYGASEFWNAEDWNWLQRAGVRHPTFWRLEPRGWSLRTVFAEIPLPDAWPAYVSHAEASAYAHWRGARLMREPEWHRAALGAESGDRDYPWGWAPPRPGTHGNFGFAHPDPVDVDASPAGRSFWGVEQLAGNGWEWTATEFAPFAGFEPLPFYRGYSADFFDGRHYVCKGASAWTDVGFLRGSFRNWFQPRYPYVFTKFRCAYDADA